MSISGLNGTARSLAVYASQCRLPEHHARLASGRWPGSAGRGWLPAGFQRKVSAYGFPLSQAFLAHPLLDSTSKYNPIERCWGILEMHWNGSLLDSIEAVLCYARSMTWKGKHPVVSVVKTTYATGVKLTPEEMAALEAEVIRTPSLEKWFVKIPRKR